MGCLCTVHSLTLLLCGDSFDPVHRIKARDGSLDHVPKTFFDRLVSLVIFFTACIWYFQWTCRENTFPPPPPPGQREHDSGLTSSGQSQWLLLWRPGGEESTGHDVSCCGSRLPVSLVSFPNYCSDSLWLIWFRIKPQYLREMTVELTLVFILIIVEVNLNFL